MMRRAIIRIVVPILAGIGVIALIAAAVVGMRGSARDNMIAYACERGWISASTCYPETASSGRYDDIFDQILLKQDLEKELAPILAEQERLKAEKREWDKNRRASDLDVQKAFIVGCERDKLVRIQEGKDVSTWDCRKGSDFR